MKTKGFTLIELMIVIAIIGILASIGMGFISGKDYLCRGGYEFDRYSGHQIIGQNGGGIPCNN